MSEETAAEFWVRIGFGHISLEDAQVAYDAAEPVPLSDPAIAMFQRTLDDLAGIPQEIDRSEWDDLSRPPGYGAITKCRLEILDHCDQNVGPCECCHLAFRPYCPPPDRRGIDEVNP